MLNILFISNHKQINKIKLINIKLKQNNYIRNNKSFLIKKKEKYFIYY